MKRISAFIKAVVYMVILSIFVIGLSNCRKPAPTVESVKEELSASPIPRELRPTKFISSSPKLLELGKRVYNKRCASCHGLDGRGEGQAAYLLYPKPRDFVDAQYRIVSTWEGVPTDEDLYYVISRGIPGSAMPSWSHLSEETRWAIVHYVKSFAEEPLQASNVESDDKEEGVIKVPPEPPYTAKVRARAKMSFAENCASCHGETGKGDGVKEQFDEKDYPISPRDLTKGIFKGGSEPEQIYRRIIAGMPGSPMPINEFVYGEEAWHLTHFILSMSSEEQRERTEMRKFRILAQKTEQIPEHPDAGAWKDVQGVNLHLMPLWWRDDRPETLSVKALHDGEQLAIRLTWADGSHDHTAIRVQDYTDAAAVEFGLTDDPPFFGMGEKGQFVNLWMWKSDRQADLDTAFQDIETVYPNLATDYYPDIERPANEQPTRHALTVESDPVFITGWGAGNIVSDPTPKSAAEDLAAQGFGTLKARPMPDRQVRAKGVYNAGLYRVVLRRSFKGSGPNSLDFSPGQTVPVAFAVWDGSAGDRDGKKSVTIWQELVIGE